MNVVVIERVADPMPGGRAQLVEHVFVDGEQDVRLTCRRGSPALSAVVRAREETLDVDAQLVEARRRQWWRRRP